MKKKILLFILVCIGIFALGSISVSAEPGVYGDLKYEIENGEVSIIGCDESATEVEIPSKIEGYSVTKIIYESKYWTNGGFYNCERLTSVTIPDTVKYIGQNAFRSCINLTSIVIPNSVTEIGHDAFRYCDKLSDITLSDNLINIGVGAFYGTAYYNNESNWEDGALYIGTALIEASSDISDEYNIKYGTHIISDRAFSDCSNLTEITIPKSVVAIGENAFVGTGYYYNESNWENGALYIGDILIATNEDLGTEYVVKSGTRLIGDCAFRGADLKSVTIPGSVEYIGLSAFYNQDIENLYIKDMDAYLKCQFGDQYSVPNSSDMKAYLNGAIIENVEIPEGITKISDYLFRGWKGLKSVTIPEGVKSIGTNSFLYCSNLTDIIMPDSIESIGWGAFYQCENLKNINMPKNLITIYSWAFNSCTGLTNVTIPVGTMWIGENAFSGTGIKTLTLPTTLKFVGKNAFSNSWSDSIGMIYGPKIERLYISDLKAYINCEYENYGSIPLSNGGGILYLDNKIVQNLVIPEGIEEIPENIFIKCKSLKSVVVPEGVKSIGDSAFSNCENLESITLPKSLTSVDRNAFCDCSGVKKVYISDLKAYMNCEFGGDRYAVPTASGYDACLYLNGEIVDNISIPEGVAKIQDNIFRSLSINSITIPDSVTSIGNYAFSNCENLTSVTIPDSVTSIGDYSFSNCENLTSVIIPDSVTSIGEYSFSYCTNLKNATLSSSITSISEGLFNCCEHLESIIIPQGVIGIGERAFLGCDRLKKVAIPNTVTEIHNKAFYCYDFGGESNLSEVYYNGTDNKWKEIFIGSDNDALTNAQRKTIYYITLIADNGNTSSVTYLPSEKIKVSDIEKKYMHKVTLYSDKAMTKEFNSATAINENLTLYVKLGEEITVIYGDIDDDGEVTMNDAIYLFNAAMFPDQYPIPSGQKTDYNGDGVFDMNDAIYLFNHAMFPDAFPI